ncbi:MAG TPA: filamentous hemagglutinin family protein, partial [Rhizomicrobium sp.]|nr:filamentous hemagglutinin family protein [Rhizomicrobium sp.]
PELEQQIFLLDNVYFNELAQTSVPDSGSFENYSRGYVAANLLFPASLGYTANNLGGGTNGANQLVETGDLDLRLSTIETEWGGNIYILGPGGRALIGSTVATSAQAALHTEVAGELYEGIPLQPGVSLPDGVPFPSTISDIPPGFEGVLTLRGGSIDTFTDQDFLLNQSRLFTEEGGNIIMWSSNGSLNAGQGPQTSSNFPPIVVQTDEDLYSFVNSSGAVTGAGIAAFEPAPGAPAPDVFLVAPRGTVDAGAAGVRVSGNLFVAAFQVANSSNFAVSGTTVGVPGSAAVNVAAQTSGSTAAAAASQAAQAVSGASNNNGADESVITVDVLGYAGGGDNSGDEEQRKRKR